MNEQQWRLPSEGTTLEIVRADMGGCDVTASLRKGLEGRPGTMKLQESPSHRSVRIFDEDRIRVTREIEKKPPF